MSTTLTYCEYCGAVANDSNAKYCSRCGNLLPAPTIPPKSFNTYLQQGSLLKQQYRILEVLGEGGMGTVYRAVDASTFNRIVAVKEVLQKEFESESDIQNAATLFEREATTLARLSHQNLPRIYTYFTEAKRWYLVMDFIDGETLEDFLKDAGGTLDIDKTLEIGEKLCTVLGYLHKQKPPIIFRDIKPDNIMLTRDDEHLYLIDFGISRRFRAVTTQSTNTPKRKPDTDPGLGSHGYAPPEQYQGYTTPLSDIYALGATLHQLLSGEQPSGNFHFEPLALTGQPGGVELNTLIMSMVDIKPEKRPTSMQVVKSTLKDIAERRSESKWASTMTHSSSIISIDVPVISPKPNDTPVEPITPKPIQTPVASITPDPTQTPVTQEEQPIPEPPPPPPFSPSTQKPRNWREFVEQNTNQVPTPPPPPQPTKRDTISQAPTQRMPPPPPSAPTLPATAIDGREFAHPYDVWCVAWSPDGTRIAVASYNVIVWDIVSGKKIATYDEHQHKDVASLCWSPDGTRIASGGWDKIVHVWDAATGNPLLYYQGHDDAVRAVAWSPDGKYITSGGQDKKVQCWSALNGMEGPTAYPAHKNTVTSLAWSPDEHILASASEDKTVHVLDVATGRILTAYTNHAGPVYSIAWSSGTKRIASCGGDKTVHVWESMTGTTSFTFKKHTKWVYSVAWSPDGKRIASSSMDKTVQIWTPETGNGTTIRCKNGQSMTVAWSPDGKYIAYGDYQSVRIAKVS
jgi:eukaryotic-like serine/threonine-protein kinase